MRDGGDWPGGQVKTTIGLFGLAAFGIWLVAWPAGEPGDIQPHGTSPLAVTHATTPSARTPDAPSEQGTQEAKALWLDFDLPPSPRRLPQRPSECTQPPPGGRWQVALIEAARKHECEEALDAWESGMQESIDYCTLARTVWLCFNEVHTQRIEDERFADFDALVPSLVHLEGDPKSRAMYAEGFANAGVDPWAWPAPSGLERRLDAFLWNEPLRRSVVDLFGEGVVADHLARDLHIELQIASALAAIPASERTAYMEDVWARRVYVIADALYGEIGRLLQMHRLEIYEEIDTQLAAAVADAPAVVREAYASARRER